MRTYAISRVKRKSFYRNIEFQTFLLISGGHIGAPNRCTNMASPYKALQFAWNVSANNSETAGHKDLRLGQIFYILVFYNISFSWLLLLDGFQFIFLLRDSENDLYRSTRYYIAPPPIALAPGTKAILDIFFPHMRGQWFRCNFCKGVRQCLTDLESRSSHIG